MPMVLNLLRLTILGFIGSLFATMMFIRPYSSGTTKFSSAPPGLKAFAYDYALGKIGVTWPVTVG